MALSNFPRIFQYLFRHATHDFKDSDLQKAINEGALQEAITEVMTWTLNTYLDTEADSTLEDQNSASSSHQQLASVLKKNNELQELAVACFLVSSHDHQNHDSAAGLLENILLQKSDMTLTRLTDLLSESIEAIKGEINAAETNIKSEEKLFTDQLITRFLAIPTQLDNLDKKINDYTATQRTSNPTQADKDLLSSCPSVLLHAKRPSMKGQSPSTVRDATHCSAIKIKLD